MGNPRGGGSHGAGADRREDGRRAAPLACLFPLKPPCSGTSAGTYHGVAEHKRVCPWIPCSCPQPDCAFLGPPAALLQCKPLIELEEHDDYGNWRQIPAFTGTCVKKCLSPSTSSRWPPSSSPRRRIMRC
nr:uncharacterized protein LOC109753955 [Aegilops tauschii subsp. strangulata]